MTLTVGEIRYFKCRGYNKFLRRRDKSPLAK